MAYSTFSSKALHTHLHASDFSPLSACETDSYHEEGPLDDSYLFDHDPKDFNDAEPQRQGFDLIPHGTILRVRMALNPGDQRDIRSPWREEGCATQNPQTGSVYLACEYTVCEDGPYYRQKIWGRIGLHSNKSPKWTMIGRSFMRGILESAYGIDRDDKTEKGTRLRKLRQYRQLDGLEFVARIDVEVDLDKNKSYNVIKVAITRGHKDYENHTGYGTGVSSYQSVNR